MKIISSPLVKKSICYFFIVLMLFQAVACNYFIPKPVTTSRLMKYNNIGIIHKYFIIHAGTQVYSLKQISMDSLNLSGIIDYAKDSIYYNEHRSYRYHNSERDILNEVHIYLKTDAPQPLLGNSKIPVSQIESITVIDPDYGLTILSYTITTLGILASIAALLMIIIIATKSSCPYIYTYNGQSYVFEGETFGGAIATNLERDDYMPLPSLKQVDGDYSIRITNELKEKQYTDIAELMTVDHPLGSRVLLDKTGQPYILSNEVSASKANSYNGENLLSVINKKDKNVFLFNNEDFSKNGITLKFNKPKEVKNAQLVLNGKNTLWFDYIFGEFLSKFGDSYNTWMEKQSKISSSERLQKMKDMDFPLSIYINTKVGWKLVDQIYTVGPLASRDFVIPIDISENAGDEIELKIETGFMFWELDYARMDFTDKTDLKVNYIKPSLAVGSGSKDWTSALLSTDKQYMIQEKIGEITEVIYKAPPVAENEQQSVFLHSRGYYELIRDFKGLPKLTELYKFKHPGYFSNYSKEKYLDLLYKEHGIASVPTDE